MNKTEKKKYIVPADAYNCVNWDDAVAQFAAIKRRELEISLLNLSGMGYTERHGK